MGGDWGGGSVTAQRRHYAQERRQAREELRTQPEPEGRLIGRCELCGGTHAWPDVRTVEGDGDAGRKGRRKTT
jgi:hypothetical protein